MDHLPHLSTTADWQTVAQNSQKVSVNNLQAIESRLKTSYSGYDTLILDHQKNLQPTTYSDAEKKLLIDFYEHPPTELKKLIQARRNDHNLDCCPYCGYPAAPDTLDHFIPKDLLPEYSFYPNNLVPQCRGCAPVKGSQYYCTTENATLFLHPIYSELISKVGILVTSAFNYISRTPSFEVNFSAPASLSKDHERIRRHIESSQIKLRAENYCNRKFTKLKKQAKKHLVNEADMTTFLKVSLSSSPPINGASTDWQSALYRAILKDQPALDYLNSLIPASPASVAEEPVVLL